MPRQDTGMEVLLAAKLRGIAIFSVRKTQELAGQQDDIRFKLLRAKNEVAVPEESTKEDRICSPESGTESPALGTQMQLWFVQSHSCAVQFSRIGSKKGDSG
jgi:hypothetical protein